MLKNMLKRSGRSKVCDIFVTMYLVNKMEALPRHADKDTDSYNIHAVHGVLVVVDIDGLICIDHDVALGLFYTLKIKKGQILVLMHIHVGGTTFIGCSRHLIQQFDRL